MRCYSYYFHGENEAVIDEKTRVTIAGFTVLFAVAKVGKNKTIAHGRIFKNISCRLCDLENRSYSLECF